MEILACHIFLPLSPLSPLPTKPSFPIKNPNPSPSIPNPKPTPVSCSISTPPDPISSNYNGWDDLELLEDPTSSIGLNPVRRFLISSGLDDSKLAFTFALGFLSALAASRVRFSSMTVIFPVSILVFAVGFSAGAARVRVADEKVRDLESFLSELMGELEKGANFNSEHLDRGRIKSCLEAIELMKKNVEGSIVGGILKGNLDFDLGGMRKMNSKSGKKIKELDFMQYLSGLFQESVIGTRPTKAKDNFKGNATEQLNLEAKNNLAIAGSEKESGFRSKIEDQESARIEGLMFDKNLGRLKEEDDKGSPFLLQ